MLKAMLAALVGLLIGGAAMAQTGSIDVKDAWARATPGKAQNGAAYLTIQSATPDRLTSVSTPVAKEAQLHTMTMQGDVMKMRPLAALDLPAGQPVTLQPGGTHIMLMGLKEPLRPGQSFPLTLHFAKGGPLEVNVTVEGVGARGAHNASGGMKMNMPMPAGH